MQFAELSALQEIGQQCLVRPCSLLPSELPRRTHFLRRVRMHLVEVLEGLWQLRQHCPSVT